MSDPDQHPDDEASPKEDSILDGGVDTDERAGRSLGIKPDEEPDEETKQEIEEERERRLDPEQRPDGAEIDNTGRTFDAEAGMFTDNEAYDDVEKPFDDPENPNTSDSDSDSEAEAEKDSDSEQDSQTEKDSEDETGEDEPDKDES